MAKSKEAPEPSAYATSAEDASVKPAGPEHDGSFPTPLVIEETVPPAPEEPAPAPAPEATS